MLMVLPYETVTFLPLYAAQEQGFFAAEGLELDFLYALGGGLAGGKKIKVDLTLAGEVACFTSVSTVIEAVLRGWGDVVAVAASAERPFFALVRSDIETIADLRGKRIMTGGGASRNEMLHIASMMGWTPGVDFSLVRGDAVDRQRAFADPDIHAVAGRTHYLAWAREEGFHALTYPSGATWFEGGIGVSRGFLRDHPDKVRKMVRAIVRGTDWVRDPANREAAVATITRFIRYLNDKDARKSYDAHREFFGNRLNEPGTKYMSDVLAAAKGVERNTWDARHLELGFLAELGIK
jgi:ABC-type nitrate/sulfonate/bicarbonate transport system substrate-binding protein